MCFIIFCLCDSCNKYTSKCVEIFIFIVSFLSFIISILGFLFIKREHLTLLCYILLIVLMFLSFIILFSIFLILIFRNKQTINNKHHKPAITFSIIGLIITITFFICVISEISQIHIHYQEINHPCSSIERNEDYIKSLDNLKLESFEEFCIHNRNYTVHIVTIKEFIIAYIFSFILLIFMLSLIYSWFNEYRRIKYLIDGSLHNFKIQENRKEKNDIEDDVENYSNEDSEERDKKIIINNNEINNESGNKNNEPKNLEKNKAEKQNFPNGISIYVSRNNLNKTFGGSSDIILTENNNDKINIKKEKK